MCGWGGGASRGGKTEDNAKGHLHWGRVGKTALAAIQFGGRGGQEVEIASAAICWEGGRGHEGEQLGMNEGPRGTTGNKNEREGEGRKPGARPNAVGRKTKAPCPEKGAPRV